MACCHGLSVYRKMSMGKIWDFHDGEIFLVSGDGIGFHVVFLFSNVMIE